jgi:hypothetical protein
MPLISSHIPNVQGVESLPQQPSLALPILLILYLSPILLLRFIPTRLLDHTPKGALASIQLLVGFLLARLAILGNPNRLVTPKPFPHIDHAALALPVSRLQLLALEGHSVDERWPETVGGLVAVDHYAVGFLQTLRKCVSYLGHVRIRSARIGKG